MKTPWFAALAAALVLTGCTLDHTLETLIPAQAAAVVLADEPGLTAALLGPSTADLPWKALDGGKPWAAAVLPSSPPSLFLALALADSPGALSTLETWARDRGGLSITKLGSYAVLTSPGSGPPVVLAPAQRFDLARVRRWGEPLALYVDVDNSLAPGLLPEGVRASVPVLPWIQKNLRGLRLSLSSRAGGLTVALTTDWRPGAEIAASLKALPVPADLPVWTGLLASDSTVAAVLVLPQPLVAAGLAALPAGPLASTLAALVPRLGPRAAVSVKLDGTGPPAWSAALEARDPQAVRQALKTLVAGGAVQKTFASLALDADTPLIYQDLPDGTGGVRARLSLGPSQVEVGYGGDRVSLASGPGALATAQGLLGALPAAAAWSHEAPSGAGLLATGSVQGFGARAALRVLGDGNAQAQVWVDAAQLKFWEEQLPRAAAGWMSGAGDASPPVK